MSISWSPHKSNSKSSVGSAAASAAISRGPSICTSSLGVWDEFVDSVKPDSDEVSSNVSNLNQEKNP